MKEILKLYKIGQKYNINQLGYWSYYNKLLCDENYVSLYFLEKISDEIFYIKSFIDGSVDEFTESELCDFISKYPFIIIAGIVFTESKNFRGNDLRLQIARSNSYKVCKTFNLNRYEITEFNKEYKNIIYSKLKDTYKTDSISVYGFETEDYIFTILKDYIYAEHYTKALFDVYLFDKKGNIINSIKRAVQGTTYSEFFIDEIIEKNNKFYLVIRRCLKNKSKCDDEYYKLVEVIIENNKIGFRDSKYIFSNRHSEYSYSNPQDIIRVDNDERYLIDSSLRNKYKLENKQRQEFYYLGEIEDRDKLLRASIEI